ncbi:M23 family metallopeptidase [Candidatus Azambacteria bacterium]|nr:M23 family metallopeptidase [Candidatus Azambacteria bacterium]
MAFNFAESSGAYGSSGFVFFGDKTDNQNPSIKASQISIKNLSNKDSLSYNEAEASAKGGPDEGDSADYEDISTIGDDSLAPDMAVITTITPESGRDSVITYKVESGDTISKIATEFGITVNTVLWANGLSSSSYIKEGQELKILPVNGVQHDVKSGDTILSISKKYDTKAEDIIAFNGLPADGVLEVGETLIIPGGEMPAVSVPKPKTIVTYPKSNIDSSSYFSFPTSGRKSQGLHGKNGIDVANKCGTPVYAASEGVVTARTTKSRSRLGAAVFGGYGNHIIIKHPNGTSTLYAHLKEILVESGSTVSKGQQIAAMGGGFEYVDGKLFRMQGAGKSTGCHLHFEVRGASNFLAKFSSY